MKEKKLIPKEMTHEIEQKLKRYTNEAHRDFQRNPEYTLTWDEQFQEFKAAWCEGWLSEEFINFAIGEA